MEEKTTQELLQLMKNSRSYEQYLSENKGAINGYMRVDRALSIKLSEKGLKKADVIERSGMEIHYGYQIFSGTKTPTRDKVLSLCLAMMLEVEETQQLLRICGYPQLDSRRLRDNALLYGFTKKLSVMDLNDILQEQNLELLNPARE